MVHHYKYSSDTDLTQAVQGRRAAMPMVCATCGRTVVPDGAGYRHENRKDDGHLARPIPDRRR